MARKLRLQFPGAIYHLLSRGDRKEEIFRDDQDRERFIATLAEACVKTGWQIHALCLMTNHFHIVAETPHGDLAAGMKWLLGTYTARFNRRHRVTGHLFSGRYKSSLVSGEGGYLRTVCDYVHLNPVRARLIPMEAPLSSYRWSSFPWFLLPAAERPEWLRVDRVFGEAGIPADTTAGRREFESRLEQRRRQEEDETFNLVRRDWCVGDEDFRQELLSRMNSRFGVYHYGPELREAGETKANRLIAEALENLGWNENDLQTHRKGDPNKVQIAEQLRAQTTMTVRWIAERLQMGSRKHLAHLLYWKGRPKQKQQKTAREPSDSTGGTILLTDPKSESVFDPSFD